MEKDIALPAPTGHSSLSVEAVLAARRSVRSYRPGALSLGEVARLLWAAQGITSSRGFRAAPSAGALYPLEVDLISGDVTDLAAGIYRYVPGPHALRWRRRGDWREALREAALQQQEIVDAAASLVIAGVLARTAAKYDGRAERYMHMEAGHAAQNVCLQAVSLGLATVVIGAFDDQGVSKVLGLADNEAPLVLLPIGHPA